MRVLKIFLLFSIFFLAGCAGNQKLSQDKMLQHAGLERLPVQEEYPDDGAVILYEDTKTQFYLDSNWDLIRNQNYHLVFIYFNDKAENWLTRAIYLDSHRKLINFQARTIKPNGEKVELSKKDLFPTQVKENFVEFSKNESVKFTFSGVEPGAILEYSYQVEISDKFSFNDYWHIQNSIPKCYSRYSIQIPTLLFEHDLSWNYYPVNTSLEKPQKMGELAAQKSRKDRNYTFFWELQDIPALEHEPGMPAWYDIAQYAVLGIPRKNWNELSQYYWEDIKDRFTTETNKDIKELALSLTEGAEDDYAKIEKIYQYTQQNYRYVAIDIDDSGYIPNFPDEIIERKYGDCKDMTVLNVVLLRALGFEAYPALVKTKDSGVLQAHIIQLDFNHMIAFVKDSSGKEYWLDATGSSCPPEEIYPSIEGVNALVIKDDGSSFFKSIPKSESQENLFCRTITIQLQNDGNITGHASLEFRGNENLSLRSSLKDATAKDVKKVIESYVNSNTPNINITNLIYDELNEIADKTTIEFDFSRDQFGSSTDKLLIINPSLFTIESQLSRYHDVEREFPIIFSAPINIKDEVHICFDKNNFSTESTSEPIGKRYEFGDLNCSLKSVNPGKVIFNRNYRLTKTIIKPEQYKDFRNFHRDIAKSNDLKFVLKKKEEHSM